MAGGGDSNQAADVTDDTDAVTSGARRRSLRDRAVRATGPLVRVSTICVICVICGRSLVISVIYGFALGVIWLVTNRS